MFVRALFVWIAIRVDVFAGPNEIVGECFADNLAMADRLVDDNGDTQTVEVRGLDCPSVGS